MCKFLANQILHDWAWMIFFLIYHNVVYLIHVHHKKLDFYLLIYFIKAFKYVVHQFVTYAWFSEHLHLFIVFFQLLYCHIFYWLFYGLFWKGRIWISNVILLHVVIKFSPVLWFWSFPSHNSRTNLKSWNLQMFIYVDHIACLIQ
jgi:hypothetical protein